MQPEQVPIVVGRVQDHEGQADGHEVAGQPKPLDPPQQSPRVDPQLLEGQPPAERTSLLRQEHRREQTCGSPESLL